MVDKAMVMINMFHRFINATQLAFKIYNLKLCTSDVKLKLFLVFLVIYICDMILVCTQKNQSPISLYIQNGLP